MLAAALRVAGSREGVPYPAAGEARCGEQLECAPIDAP